ncbi:MAG: GTPase HflX [Bacteroidota bacterium]
MTKPAPGEGTILVGVGSRSLRRSRAEDPLGELALLAESAGARVECKILQERSAAHPATFIGSGKAREIGWLVREKGIRLVIFDEDLTPVQIRNLQRILGCKVLDRSGLILDIFASRARTSEAHTQVELAQLQYMLPRLTRQWTHLSKQFGGIGTKGPGETQIETDRRAIRTRISHLREKLRRIDRERAVQRKGRDRLPRIALVGYTNAGKSTLLNLFSGADVLVQDRLFATLDATVRLVVLAPGRRMLLADTVGFIRRLPHHLVASFKSTLDEVREADLLLHVTDISHPGFEEHIAVVRETLHDIGAGTVPVIPVFNKIDRIPDRSVLPHLGARYPEAVFVSAARGINIGALRDRILGALDRHLTEQTIRLTHGDHSVISRLHEVAEILETVYEGDSITVRLRVDEARAGLLKRILARRKGARRP